MLFHEWTLIYHVGKIWWFIGQSDRICIISLYCCMLFQWNCLSSLFCFFQFIFIQILGKIHVCVRKKNSQLQTSIIVWASTNIIQRIQSRFHIISGHKRIRKQNGENERKEMPSADDDVPHRFLFLCWNCCWLCDEFNGTGCWQFSHVGWYSSASYIISIRKGN